MFLDDQTKVFHHETNAKGRDFIVGDLHGCRAMLDELLEHAAFDPQSDRLFSTGDLVDRGPDSIGCLELLKEPWFFPVLGDHDAMLFAWLLNQPNDKRCRVYSHAFTHNQGWEWAKAQREKAAKFLPLLQQVPLVRVVGKDTPQRFQVVHAELFDSLTGHWTDAALDCQDESRWQEQPHFIQGFGRVGTWIDHALWGRDAFSHRAQQIGKSLEGLSPTYVGHTIVPQVLRSGPLTISGHIYLDAGAYRCLDPVPGLGLILWSPSSGMGWRHHGDGILTIIGQPAARPKMLHRKGFLDLIDEKKKDCLKDWR